MTMVPVAMGYTTATIHRPLGTPLRGQGKAKIQVPPNNMDIIIISSNSSNSSSSTEAIITLTMTPPTPILDLAVTVNL